jgi:hypothetical protein
VFDHGAGAGEAGQVAGLGQDSGAAKSRQADDRGDQLGQLQLVEHSDHAGLGLCQALPGVPEIIQEQLHPLQRAGTVSGHSPGVGTGREEQPHNPKTRRRAHVDAGAGFNRLWPAAVKALFEAGENHTKGVERLLGEGNRTRFFRALKTGGLYEKLRGDLATSEGHWWIQRVTDAQARRKNLRNRCPPVDGPSWIPSDSARPHVDTEPPE